MRPAAGARPVLSFGAFEIDTARRRLYRGGTPVILRDRHLDVLIALVRQAPDIVTKDQIIERAWHGRAVTDSNLVQAIGALRELLAGHRHDESVIKTHHRVGYQFVAPLEPVAAAGVDTDLDEAMALAAEFGSGRGALESLDLDRIEKAGQVFARLIEREPRNAAAKLGMANVCFLRHEATRADAEPDGEALAAGAAFATESWQLAPVPDAWGTLALIRHRQGAVLDAIGLARRAQQMEPWYWPHDLRFAAVSWGEERLRAVTNTQVRVERVPVASYLAATVLVARNRPDAALQELQHGCAVQDGVDVPRFSAAGLHLLQGYILLATGDHEGALAEFDRELQRLNLRHVYGREAAVNAHLGVAAVRLREGREDDARAAIERMLALAPTHVLGRALAGRLSLPSSGGSRLSVATIVEGRMREHGGAAVVEGINGATVIASLLALDGRHEEAASLCHDALQRGQGADGWMIPVNPLLHVAGRPGVWARVLALLGARAL